MTSGAHPTASVTPTEGNGAVARPAPSVPSYAREDLLAAVAALAPSLSAAADEVERGRTLTEPLVQAMVDAGLYRMFLPRSLGGGEVDPLTYFDVIEALARADSTAGWSVLISTSVIAGTARALPDETLAAMFTTPRDALRSGVKAAREGAAREQLSDSTRLAARGMVVAEVVMGPRPLARQWWGS